MHFSSRTPQSRDGHRCLLLGGELGATHRDPLLFPRVPLNRPRLRYRTPHEAPEVRFAVRHGDVRAHHLCHLHTHRAPVSAKVSTPSTPVRSAPSPRRVSLGAPAREVTPMILPSNVKNYDVGQGTKGEHPFCFTFVSTTGCLAPPPKSNFF